MTASFEYQLQRAPVGVVILDLGRRITAFNSLAGRLLGVDEFRAIGMDILDLHPSSARTKVRGLIDAADNAIDGTSAMVVTTPMGSLVAKVTQLGDQGYCMMFHTMGEVSMGAELRPPLLKLPLVRGGKTALIDIVEVACLTAQGHYSEAATPTGDHLCPLPLAELERRVDPQLFVRVHRRHLVNLRHVLAAERVDGAWTLALGGDRRIPVSRGKVEMIRHLLAV